MNTAYKLVFCIDTALCCLHLLIFFCKYLFFPYFLFQLLKTQSIVGKYDTLVAHADTDAIGFFKIHGLTDDPLLNDQFKYR